MTLLVCSMCQSSLEDGAAHCPKCGPQSLALIISEELEAAPAAEADLSRRLGRALGPEYEVVGLLGRGGFAEVYEVRDVDLQRRLAVKVLRPDIAWTSGLLARFKQEARAIARLNHPHTVPIHFVGEGEGLVFYTMPFIEGMPLSDLLRTEGALEPVRAVALTLPILDALGHAHGQGIVHRDIKPDNVMIERATGRPLLVDFGIAKQVGSAPSHHTQTGFVVGTPLYMSPEQALGQTDIDARADLYAVGAMLFQMLTGTPPFEGSSSQEIVSKHLNDPVPVPVSCNARIPVWLSDVILRAMAKRPGDRYESAEAMAEALRLGSGGSTGQITAARVASRLSAEAPTVPLTPEELAIVRTPSEPSAAPPVRRRGRRVAAVGGLALVAAAGFGAFRTLQPRPTLWLANHLSVAIEVGGADTAAAAVQPGDSIRLALPRRDAVVDWWVLRPTDAAGHVVGDSVGGRIVEATPVGEVHRAIETASLARFLLPVVANRTGRVLSARLSGPRGTLCDDCRIAPGDLPQPLGYYSAAAVDSLELRDPAGRMARYAISPVEADPVSGRLVIEVGPRDFPRRPSAAPVRPDSQPRSGASLPSDSATAVSPPPAPRPDTAPADSAAPPKQAPRTNDPLRGIFPNRP